jgi:hypothetical protein
MAPLRHLANDSSRLSSDNTEAWDDHIGRYDRVVEDPNVVLDDGKLAYHYPCANVYVTSDRGSLNDGARADENVVVDSEWHVGKSTVDNVGLARNWSEY